MFYGSILGDVLWHNPLDFSFPPPRIYVETIFSCSFSEPIKSHVYCSGHFFSFSLTILFAAVLSVATSVCGCRWPIYARAVLIDVSFWKFADNPPKYASLAYSITFLIILHSTYNGPFSGGIKCIGVLYFGLSKKYQPALLCASVFCAWDVCKYIQRTIPLLLYYVTTSVCVSP